MKTLLKKPHLFFFSLMPLFIIIGFIRKSNLIDVSIYNTFLAVQTDYWCYFSAVFVGLIGLNYYMLYWAKKPTTPILSLFHILFQVAALVPFIFSIFFLGTTSIFTSNFLYDSVDFYQLLSTSYLLFVISIGFHILNFISGFINKSK